MLAKFKAAVMLFLIEAVIVTECLALRLEINVREFQHKLRRTRYRIDGARYRVIEGSRRG